MPGESSIKEVAKTTWRVVRWGGGALFVVVLFLGAFLSSHIHPTLNFTYLKRAYSYNESTSIGDVAWYTPLAQVKGRPTPFPEADFMASSELLEKAARWAKRRRSYALLVAHRGRLVFERYWRGHDRTSLADSASMAKTVLALAVGKAVERGFIHSVDDLVATYLPNLRSVPSGLTVKHLLQMSSGLAVLGSRKEVFSPTGRLLFGLDLWSVLQEQESWDPPGRAFRYSNFDSQILLFLLEAATRQPYAQFLSENLWQPMGAEDAAIYLDRPGGNAHGYCCLFARPHDWLRVGQLLLDGGKVGPKQIIPAKWIQRMVEPSPLSSLYGFQVWLGKRTGQVRLHGRNKQTVYVLPHRDLVVVRLGERPRGGTWDGSYLPKWIARAFRDGMTGG